MQWIKDIVLGLTEVAETNDVYELMNYLNINLIKMNIYNSKGFFATDLFKNQYIYIDENLNTFEEISVIAHELGHAVLHPWLNTSNKNNGYINNLKLEKQANLFAAELLISDNLDFQDYDNLTRRELSVMLNVPENYIDLKFNV